MTGQGFNQYDMGFAGFNQPYHPPWSVPGYQMAMLQQLHQQSVQSPGQFQPQAMEMPTTALLKSVDAHSLHDQMQYQMQMYQTITDMYKSGQNPSEKKPEEIIDKVEDEPKVITAESVQKNKADEDISLKVKAEMKRVFVAELLRRQAVSGTFEMTEGTVKPFKRYEAGDPVAAWYSKNRGEDKTGQAWDPECDCEYLRDAMKGLGTNDDAIILVVSTRCNQQRQELKDIFKTIYGRDLIKDIKGELSGDYKELVMALFVAPAEYDAWCIKEAIYGLGTDEQALVEILLTRTNEQIKEIRQAYPDVVHKKKTAKASKFEKDIADDTSGDFKKLLISASMGRRYEISHDKLSQAVQEVVNPDDGAGTGMYEVNYRLLSDQAKAKNEAQQLYKAGEKRWGTDEETFNRIFSSRDYYQLRATWDEYVKVSLNSAFQGHHCWPSYQAIV